MFVSRWSLVALSVFAAPQPVVCEEEAKLDVLTAGRECTKLFYDSSFEPLWAKFSNGSGTIVK